MKNKYLKTLFTGLAIVFAVVFGLTLTSLNPSSLKLITILLSLWLCDIFFQLTGREDKMSGWLKLQNEKIFGKEK